MRGLVTGGTHTYGNNSSLTFIIQILYYLAPPERDIQRRQDHSIQVGHAEDIWSFGCILAEFVTWAVLGSNGIRQFRKNRQNAIQRLPSLQSPHKFVKITNIKGAFHNVEYVLLEVKHWFRRLRDGILIRDQFTREVLDLVKTKMLVYDPREHITAADLSQALDHIFSFSIKAAQLLYPSPRATSVKRNAIYEVYKRALTSLSLNLRGTSIQKAITKTIYLANSRDYLVEPSNLTEPRNQIRQHRDFTTGETSETTGVDPQISKLSDPNLDEYKLLLRTPVCEEFEGKNIQFLSMSRGLPTFASSQCVIQCPNQWICIQVEVVLY